MKRDAIGWISAVMGDVLFRLPPSGIIWRADRRTAPVSVLVRLPGAEEDFPTLTYPAGDQAPATVQFAREAQQAVVARYDTPLPACREHQISLDPYVSEEGTAGWRCPRGDLRCAVGDFAETLWPPHWWERLDPALVSDRLGRRGLHFLTLGVDDGPDGPVASAWLYEGADLPSYEAAVAPYPFRVTRWLPPEHTNRLDREIGRGGVRYRSLTRSGGRRLAGLCGRLDRARPDEPGDFVVISGADDRTPVRLLAAHVISDTEPFLLLDERGKPFARVGDEARCIGGYRPNPVDSEPPVFMASELRVRDGSP